MRIAVLTYNDINIILSLKIKRSVWAYPNTAYPAVTIYKVDESSNLLLPVTPIYLKLRSLNSVSKPKAYNVPYNVALNDFAKELTLSTVLPFLFLITIQAPLIRYLLGDYWLGQLLHLFRWKKINDLGYKNWLMEMFSDF